MWVNDDGKDGKLVRKFNRFECKELVGQANLDMVTHIRLHSMRENRTIHVYLNKDCVLVSGNTAKSHCLNIHKCEKRRLILSLSIVTSMILCDF